MDGFQWIGIALAALALIGVAYQAFAWVQLGRFFSSSLPRAGGVGGGLVGTDATLAADRPSSNPSREREGNIGVTILKPLHGAEPRLAENLATFLEQQQDGPVQLICGLADGADAARPAVEAMQRQHPHVTLVIDPTRHGANAKVGNLINMVGAAQHEVIVLSDSDMAVGRGYLTALLNALEEPEIGAVTCLYRGRGDAGLWSQVSAGIISHVALPDMVVGYTTGLARPCMGSTIALRRGTLDAVGGFGRFADVLADDHAIGVAVAELGLKVAIPPLLITHACAERSFGALWRQKLRWAATIRGLQPWGYAGSIVTRPVPLALLAALFVPSLGLPLALAALAIRLAVVLRVERVAGDRSAPLWTLPLVDLVDFIVFAASFTVRKVDWRGKRLTIVDEGRVAA